MNKKELITKIANKFIVSENEIKKALSEYIAVESFFSAKERRAILKIYIQESDTRERIQSITKYIFTLIIDSEPDVLMEKIAALTYNDTVFRVLAKFNLYDYVSILKLNEKEIKDKLKEHKFSLMCAISPHMQYFNFEGSSITEEVAKQLTEHPIFSLNIIEEIVRHKCDEQNINSDFLFSSINLCHKIVDDIIAKIFELEEEPPEYYQARVLPTFYIHLIPKISINIFNLPQFRGMLLAIPELNNRVIKELYKTLSNPKLSQQHLTKRRNWTIYFLIEKLRNEGVSKNKASGIIAKKYNIAQSSTRQRYYEGVNYLKNANTSEDDIKIEYGLHERINQEWETIKKELKQEEKK